MPSPPISLSVPSTSDGVSIDVTSIDDISVLLSSVPQSSIRNLSSKQKYLLFLNHFRPNSSYRFPSRYADG